MKGNQTKQLVYTSKPIALKHDDSPSGSDISVSSPTDIYELTMPPMVYVESPYSQHHHAVYISQSGN